MSSKKRFGLIIVVIAVPVVPMTVMVPIPILARNIVVIVMAIVARIIATIVYGIGVAIGRSDRYAKVTVSFRFLGHESDEPER